MKLKYYMRGLGIGIILTTLILTIGGSKRQLSDKEIIARATELGMEMKGETNEDLDKVLENLEITQTPSIAPTQEPTVIPTLEPTATPTPTAEPSPTAKPTVKPTQKPTAAPTDTPSSEAGGKGVVAVTVKSGMSSGQVAALLVEKGLIDNADDFNLYIVKAGKASIIRVGTYSLPKGSNYDEIINTLTEK